MAYNNKNDDGLFGCNFTYCVQNSLYLKIFGFILYEFKCFGDKDSFSIPKTKELVFFDFNVHKKDQLRQILRYITPGSWDNMTMFIRKVVFHYFQHIYRPRFLKEH